MDFFVNGQNFDITIEDEKTIGDVLKSFQIYCDENEAAVIGIKIDDNIVTADNFDDVKTQELSDSTKFEFNIITKTNISESFQKLSELFTELATRMEQIPVDLQTGNENNARIAIKTLADNIDDFCHIATLATLFQEYNSIEIDGKPFAEFFSDFSPILKDFEEALKNNDTVMIGDLAEYEFPPRLNAIAKTLQELK